MSRVHSEKNWNIKIFKIMYFIWNLVDSKEFCSNKKPFYNIAKKKKLKLQQHDEIWSL